MPALATTIISGLATAQSNYPPIKVVAVHGAGGTDDAIGRLAAERMSTELGQPVIVEKIAAVLTGHLVSSFVPIAGAGDFPLALAVSGTAKPNTSNLQQLTAAVRAGDGVTFASASGLAAIRGRQNSRAGRGLASTGCQHT